MSKKNKRKRQNEHFNNPNINFTSKLSRFLKCNGIFYDNFIEALHTSNRGAELFRRFWEVKTNNKDEKYSNDPLRFIYERNNMFGICFIRDLFENTIIFHRTNEGGNYWHDINAKWKDYVNSNFSNKILFKYNINQTITYLYIEYVMRLILLIIGSIVNSIIFSYI